MPSEKTVQNSRNKFRKRKANFLKKAHQLSQLCNADVAVIIYKDGHYYTYRSKDTQTWPPSMQEIVHITYP
ncbi:hypothetical protein BDD12DRAFT_811217 [Trichophaea hybrida]|nr:hypothetical protein BDD12DRAFT_811217 [Trichophaea hybrida]